MNFLFCLMNIYTFLNSMLFTGEATPINDNQGNPQNTTLDQISSSSSSNGTPKPNKLKDRMEKLLYSGKGTDVYFLVKEDEHEKELFTAHKLILSAASEVFKTMFEGDQTNSPITAGSANDDPIVVTDIDIVAFNTMLRYIYTDNLDESEVPNWFSVLYAGQIGRDDKFLVTFSILSLNGELKNNIKQKVFYPKSARSYGYGEFIGVSKLMNPSNGLYDKEADTVTLVIGVTSDEKKLHV